MDTPQGRIIALHDGDEPAYAVVEVAAPLRCARCAAGKGCGAMLVDGRGRAKRFRARVTTRDKLRVGDSVRVELAPHDVLQAALVVYGVPLVGALLGAAVSALAGGSDGTAVLAALAGLAAGAAIGRSYLRRDACLSRFTPTITSRLATAEPA